MQIKSLTLKETIGLLKLSIAAGKKNYPVLLIVCAVWGLSDLVFQQNLLTGLISLAIGIFIALGLYNAGTKVFNLGQEIQISDIIDPLTEKQNYNKIPRPFALLVLTQIGLLLGATIASGLLMLVATNPTLLKSIGIWYVVGITIITSIVTVGTMLILSIFNVFAAYLGVLENKSLKETFRLTIRAATRNIPALLLSQLPLLFSVFVGVVLGQVFEPGAQSMLAATLSKAIFIVVGPLFILMPYLLYKNILSNDPISAN